MKKSKLVHLTSLLLASLIMLFSVACGKASSTESIGNNDTSLPHPSNEEETEIQFENTVATEKNENKTKKPIVPIEELDFEKKELSILYRDNVQSSREWFKEVVEDELDEAVAARNETVQKTLNLKLVFKPIASNGSDYSEYSSRFQSTVLTDVLTGAHEYDISANLASYSTSVAIRGCVTNLLDTELFPYFDFSNPAWNQSIVNDTKMNGRLHYVTGDLNLSLFDATAIMFHNRALYDKYREESDPESIQQLALDGKWTYEELYRLTNSFYSDSGAPNDKIALIISTDTPSASSAIPYAWNLEFIATNADGSHAFDLEDNKKAEAALLKYRSLLYADGTSTEVSAFAFAEGNAIFYMSRFYRSYEENMIVRESIDLYELLPIPKYDLSQKQYASSAQDYFSLMFVIDHSNSSTKTDGNMTSAFLQLASETAYTDTRGYYFNRVVKFKYFGTDDKEYRIAGMIEIFTIIADNIILDFCNVYSPQLADVKYLWIDATAPGETKSLKEIYLDRKTTLDHAIRTTDEWLGLCIKSSVKIE